MLEVFPVEFERPLVVHVPTETPRKPSVPFLPLVIRKHIQRQGAFVFLAFIAGKLRNEYLLFLELSLRLVLEFSHLLVLLV